jgi:Cu-Zn family superoxide dismutase
MPVIVTTSVPERHSRRPAAHGQAVTITYDEALREQIRGHLAGHEVPRALRLSQVSRGYAPFMMKHVALVLGAVVAMSGCSNQISGNSSTSTTSSGSSSAQVLTTQLNTADGKHAADATIDFTNGYATVTVQTVAGGILSPGFHGLHIHAVGTCEANSVAPGGGQSADFASAGDHFQAPGHTGQPASGDLPPLLVRSDGSGKLVATSDAFTEDQLKGSEGSSIVLHQGTDIGSQSSADSDKRIACGVFSPASAASTSVSTSISTSTITTTAVTTVPPATVTATPSSTSPTSSSGSTSTVTVTQPTLTFNPPAPGFPHGPNG